ncbi:MAG: hypothetical protein QOE00_4 [Ilumatobacteraceae bacterium]
MPPEVQGVQPRRAATHPAEVSDHAAHAHQRVTATRNQCQREVGRRSGEPSSDSKLSCQIVSARERFGQRRTGTSRDTHLGEACCSKCNQCAESPPHRGPRVALDRADDDHRASKETDDDHASGILAHQVVVHRAHTQSGGPRALAWANVVELGKHRSDRNATRAQQQEIPSSTRAHEPHQTSRESCDEARPPRPSQPSDEQSALIGITGQVIGNLCCRGGQQPPRRQAPPHAPCLDRRLPP